MAHRSASPGDLRCLRHRESFATVKGALGAGAVRPPSGESGPQNEDSCATLYDAASAFASALARPVFGALLKLSQVAAKTISAPTNTQICSGSP